MVVSEDGLPCQPTKTLDQICIEEYSCVILPGMVNIGPALQDEKLISFLRDLGEQDILIAAISSAPLLLAKAGLLKDTEIYRWNLAKLLWLFWISSTWEFPTQTGCAR